MGPKPKNTPDLPAAWRWPLPGFNLPVSIAAPAAPTGDGMSHSHGALDRAVRARLGKMTYGISPYAVASAWTDWWFHLLQAPGKQISLALSAADSAQKLAAFAVQAATSAAAMPSINGRADPRFADGNWGQWPFNVIAQSFLLTQQWWEHATTNIRGMSRQHARLVPFIARQRLDTYAPSNSPLLNPDVLARTADESGANLVRGWNYLVEDMRRALARQPPQERDSFRVGENIACSS